MNRADARRTSVGSAESTVTAWAGQADRWVLWTFLALSVAKAAAYWVGARLQWPDDPWSTLVLYRGADIQTLPLVRHLTEGHLGEPGLFESYNTGVLHERYVPWLLHAGLWRVMGPAAFVVGDLVVTAVRYLLLGRVLVLGGTPRVLAWATSGVLTCAITEDFGHLWRATPVQFWGLRMPRPFLTELFLLLSLVGLVAVVRERFEGRSPRLRDLVATGAGVALLAQGDLYFAAAQGLAIAGCFVLLSRRSPLMDLVRWSATLTAAAVVAALPGIAQSRFLTPEGAERLGLFPIDRWHWPAVDLGPMMMTGGLLLGLGALVARVGRQGLDSGHRALRWVALALVLGASVALPLSFLVSAHGLELYHFQDTFARARTIAGLVLLLQALQVAWRALQQRMAPPVAGTAAAVRRLRAALIVAPATMACLASTSRFATERPARRHHLRNEFAEWGAIPDYRSAFVGLVRELSRPEYGARPVLGTFDHQVWSWWLAFRGGYSFLGDACTSNTSNAELERRVVGLARTVGMGPGEVVTFLRRRYVMIFWLSCERHRAFADHAWAPLSDYDDADRERIARTGAFEIFPVALPRSEQHRLEALAAAAVVPPRERLDVIVLTRDESLEGRTPDPAAFDLTWENERFRVWRRRPGA